jgi:hypothetical protein
MVTLNDVHDRTAAFLDLHWPDGEDRPVWSAPWTFAGTIPNQDLKGVYAHLRGDAVIYVGVGAGRGPGKYEGAGLGSRLHRYWMRHPTEPRTDDGEPKYAPTEVFGESTELAAIVTLGFPADRSYLAYALEAYLIGELKPEKNVVGVGRRGTDGPSS